MSVYGAAMTKPKTDAKSVRQASIGRMLNLITRRTNAEMKTRLVEIGLTPSGFFVMMNLLDIEAVTQADLGKKITLPAYGMTRLIDALAADGLVERRPDPASRRNHLIFLTDAGRALAPAIFKIVGEVNTALLNPLTPAEQQQFADSLAKLL